MASLSREKIDGIGEVESCILVWKGKKEAMGSVAGYEIVMVVCDDEKKPVAPETCLVDRFR